MLSSEYTMYVYVHKLPELVLEMPPALTLTISTAQPEPAKYNENDNACKKISSTFFRSN